jgi:hypothetical protein
MQKYTIVISEQQRHLLIDALRGVDPSNVQEEEYGMLLSMLEDMEEDEDVINDFTA